MKIICVGRNYADHIAELKNEKPTDPVLFLKPETAILIKNQPFFIPDFTNEVHHEVELVVRINRLGKNIRPEFAHKYYNQISLGIDFTARDLQSELKGKGLPWEKAKSFDGSAAVGKFISFDPKNTDIQNIDFSFRKNGEIVQSGNTSEMIHKVDDLISYISKYFTLKIGDLIFTGTPSGVSKVNPGDKLEAFLQKEQLLLVNVK